MINTVKLSEEEVLQNIHVVCADYFDAEKHKVFPADFIYDYTLIYFVVDGKCIIKTEKQVQQLKKEDLFILAPNINHMIDCCNSFKCALVGVNGFVMVSKNKNNNIIKSCPFLVFNDYKNKKPTYKDIIYQILEENHSRSHLYSTYSDLLISMLMINILRNSEYDLDFEINYKKDSLMDHVKKYIDFNFSDDINLVSLANKFNMNKFTLLRSFKKKYDITPMDYLQRRRITECKKMLLEGSNSIKEISCYAGFSSQSYFNQVFKKVTGTSPNKYKNNFLRNSIS